MGDRTGQQFGNYRLTHLLGTGGFAEVYLGQHVLLGTQTAIKILHQEHMSPDEQEAFAQEARMVAGLTHPNIVRLLDFGFQNETPFLVMDYARGGTIRKAHARGARLSLEEVTNYTQQVAEALQYAHDQHLIHRDIKPENMLLGARQEVLVGDFGIALAVQSSRAQSTQEVIGTAQYMAPEQIVGKPHLASDQYSLGIVVYEWLTGAAPFRGAFTEICAQHLFMPLPPLRAQRPDLHPDIEEVLSRALAKKPEERFASVRAFATALGSIGQVTVRSAKSYPPASAPTRDAVGSRAPSDRTLDALTPQEEYHPTVPSLRAYEALCRQLEQNGATGPFAGALVVRVPEQQIGQTVYLQLRHDWLENKQKGLLSAPVQHFSIQGFTLTVAIFQQVSANTYMLLAGQQQPVEVAIRSSKAIMKNLVRTNVATPPKAARNTGGAGSGGKVVNPVTQAYETLCRQLEKNGSTGPFAGALVVRVPEQQLGQVVYLQLPDSYNKKTRKDLLSAAVQRHSVDNQMLTAAIFQRVSANTYSVWMDQRQAMNVAIYSSKAVLLDFRSSQPE